MKDIKLLGSNKLAISWGGRETESSTLIKKHQARASWICSLPAQICSFHHQKLFFFFLFFLSRAGNEEFVKRLGKGLLQKLHLRPRQEEAGFARFISLAIDPEKPVEEERLVRGEKSRNNGRGWGGGGAGDRPSRIERNT